MENTLKLKNMFCIKSVDTDTNQCSALIVTEHGWSA